MPAQRSLIVNADDFGQTPGINRGVIRAHRDGIVTSTSLMVRWPSAAEAAAYGREHPEISVGLHLDLGEWTHSEGRWSPLYQVVPTENEDAVTEEVHRQVGLFKELTGMEPTHLDSHQHVHRSEPVRSVMLELGQTLDVPVRHFHPEVRYSGEFYGQTGKGSPVPEGLTVPSLVRLLKSLPPGTTELGCHPGITDGDLGSMYSQERAQELATLTDPRVREFVRSANLRLCSFHGATRSSVAQGPDRPR
jgi:chitin disaccharide deacetylase